VEFGNVEDTKKQEHVTIVTVIISKRWSLGSFLYGVYLCDLLKINLYIWLLRLVCVVVLFSIFFRCWFKGLVWLKAGIGESV